MNMAYQIATGAGGDRPRLPGSLHVNRRLSQWLRIRRAGYVEITSGKVELGQGILTALRQIAADELDVSLDRVRLVPASTAHSPDEGVTSGSLSVQESGTALRYACAEARAIYLAAAARKLGVSVETLRIEDGEIAGPGNLSTSYWELADDALLAREATGAVAPKPAGDRRLAGNAAARVDIPDKVFGRARFLHDLVLPEMLHGRVLRPPSIGATLESLDKHAGRLPGVVAVVRDGSFVGVVAETEAVAKKAVERLRSVAVWRTCKSLPDAADIPSWLKAQPVETTVVASRSGAPLPATRTVRREYTKPFLAHASIGPSCAIAHWRGGGVHVRTHSQGVYNLQADLALALGAARERVTVEHVEGAGCYGHNGADDVALDAALLARAADGRPVRVQWSREDELGWAPFGPAMLVAIEADLDADGEVVAWRHQAWSNGHSIRPGRAKTPTLLAAAHLAKPFEQIAAINAPLAAGGGAERNAVPEYDFPSLHVVNHRVLTMPLRASALRSLGALANVFALEQMVDEIAAERGENPVAYRLRHLSDPRARAVIERAAVRAGWSGRKRVEGTGFGIAYARYKATGAYCAVVAEVEAEREIRVQRLVIAVDVGEVINPDGVANQIEGGAIQATSWTLKEAVQFDRERVTSDTWETYPILRFSEVPAVEIDIIARPDEKPLGAGEAAQGPVAAAIANAVNDALGIRIRDLPITPERIVAAMG
ncbi:MAG TPA: molybdopterin cofactor-binding domain-containing protein [Alphaproteobacteria bacterium]|nr:molybdopterin cofactor-binding domain-containing protein [Alphaproteobacteria bacterium]